MFSSMTINLTNRRLLGLVLSLLGLVVAVATKPNAQINDVHLELGLDPDAKLATLYPELFKPIDANWTEIDSCYTDQIDHNRTLNIFNQSIASIVHQYLVQNEHDIWSDSKEEISNVIIGLFELVQLISQCMTKALEHRTKYGLTSMSSFHESPNSIVDNNNTSLIMKKGRKTSKYGTNKACSFRLKSKQKLPKEFDWRERNAVTPVKFQGSCNSCYIFAAVASFESAILRKRHRQVILSEQAILNCNKDQCNNGYPHEVFDYLVTQGAVQQKYEPYKGKPAKTCSRYPHKSRYKLRDYCYFQTGRLTDRQLQTLVYKYGPVVAAIDSKPKPLKHLKGYYNGEGCTKNVDHAVNIVGWTEKYWIIKNTWGQHWGVDGYLYLKRGDNICGINTLAGVAIF